MKAGQLGSALVVSGVIVFGAVGPSSPAFSAGSYGSKAPAAQRAAERTVDRLVRAVVVPRGATVVRGVPPEVVAQCGSVRSRNLVDHHRVWRVPLEFGDASSFIREHPPDGLASSGGCSGGDGIIETVGFVFDAPERSTPNVVRPSVHVSVTPRAAGGSWIRADGQALWRAPRSPRSIVGSRDRVVTVSRSSLAHPKRAGPIRVVTRPRLVRRLTNAFNDLVPSIPIVYHGCPNGSADTALYTLTFRSRRHSAPAVVAKVSSVCLGGVRVTAAGRRVATLELGAVLPKLLADVSRP